MNTHQAEINIAASSEFFDISEETVMAAARAKFGPDVRVSAPYWLHDEVMRFGISTDNGNASFGANFHFKEGVFR